MASYYQIDNCYYSQHDKIWVATMPQQSKYSDSQFETLMQDIVVALEKNQATRDLSLMALGNVITNIFLHQVHQNQREKMAEQFTQVLLKSIKGK